MGADSTYHVVFTGVLAGGYEKADVTNAFAALFKISPDKAAVFIKGRRTVKKDLPLKQAQVFQQKLESIGMKVELEMQAPAIMELSLEPIESEAEAAAVAPANVVATPLAASIEQPFCCPKCGLEQERGEQCVECGVFMHKIAVQQTRDGGSRFHPEEAYDAPEEGKSAQDLHQRDVTELSSGGALNVKALSAAAAAAFGGALVWKFIVIAFSYELGLIAWGIGGLVGFVAASLGARGDTSGAICGVLALLAIMGGKYMATAELRDQWQEELQATMQGEDMRPVYEEEMRVAQDYTLNVKDDTSLKGFIVEWGYSEAIESSDVTQEDIDIFKQDYAPYLESLAAENPTFEQWSSSSSLNNALTDVSTLDVVTGSLGLMDVIFLFLGIGTAYRLGRGAELA